MKHIVSIMLVLGCANGFFSHRYQYHQNYQPQFRLEQEQKESTRNIGECYLTNENRIWSDQCIKSIASGMSEMHKWNDGSTISLIGGVPCIGRTVGRFKRFQLTWDGFFECPYLTSGKSSGHRSRSSAIQHAIQEFLVANQNVFTGEQKLELSNYIQS